MTAYYFVDLQAAIYAGMGYLLLPEWGHDVGCTQSCMSKTTGLWQCLASRWVARWLLLC